MADQTTETPVVTETVKSGWKTTEFWLTLASAISGLGVLFGFITPDEMTTTNTAIANVVGSIMTIIPIGAYAFSRAKTKQVGTAGIDTNALMMAMVTAVTQQATQNVVAPKVDEESK